MSDEQSQKRMKLRPLSKYEQDMMLRARAQHRENIVKEQKCWGKTFQGSAFLPKPEKILFKDFEVGQTYTQTITMTNVSFTFNSFKLLPLDPAVKDFFQIQYQPAGKMSAGLSCPITITFTPQVNQDIVTVFPILAETGKIDVPLICLCQKVILSLESSTISFGDVIFGEFNTKTLVIKNDGALNTTYRVLDRNGEPIPSQTENTMLMTQDSASLTQSEAMGDIPLEQLPPDSFFAMLKFKRTGTVRGYSTHSITFKFQPIAIGDFEEEILLEFDNNEIIKVLIKAVCIDVPLYVDNLICDFQVCVLGHTYREKIILWNRSVNPMKIQLKYPREARDHLDFSPTLGYVQGSDKFEIWCKFRPDAEAARKLANFTVTHNVYKIPISITGANQIRPVLFDVLAEVTVDNIVFDPPLLDFGEVYVSTGAKHRFVMRSMCELPQYYSFVRLPPTISISPNDGFGTILPGEELELWANYRPAPVKPGTELGKDMNDIYLRVRTGDICAREFKLPFTVKLQHCPLKISPAHIILPSLPIGETSEVMISITNVSRKLPYMCEILIPPYEISGFTAAPMVIPKLTTGETARVMFKFKSDFRSLKPTPPPTESEEEKLAEEEEEDHKEEEEEEDYTEEYAKLGAVYHDFDKKDPSARTQHWDWIIPVCFKSLTPDAQLKRTFLEVHSTIVNKVLVATPSELDFGEVAVSSRKLLEINLYNSDSRMVSIRMDPLPPFSGFSIINALRDIQPGKTHIIIIEFEPVNQQYFEELLTLRSQSSSISVVLKGRGVRPHIDIEPADGLLNMGNCIPNDFIEKAFTIKNLSSFAVEYELKNRGRGPQNYNGMPNFIYLPSRARIEAKQNFQVKVRFHPDHVSQKYFEHLLVEVPNQIDPKELYIGASCWQRTAYVKKDLPFQWPDSSELAGFNYESNFGFLSRDSGIKRLVLSFNNSEQGRVKRIVIGNCKLIDNKSEKPANFEIVLTKTEGNIFAIDNPKGAVPAGNEVKAGFTFTPPAADPLLGELEVLHGIGQWVECLAEVKVSGGFVPPGVTDAFVVEVLLRGYIDQI